MMKTENQTKLQRKGITISVSPEVKARRTIFARRILPHVGNKTAEELKTEIELQQHWAKINCVTKIKDYTHNKNRISRQPQHKKLSKPDYWVSAPLSHHNN